MPHAGGAGRPPWFGRYFGLVLVVVGFGFVSKNTNGLRCDARQTKDTLPTWNLSTPRGIHTQFPVDRRRSPSSHGMAGRPSTIPPREDDACIIHMHR